jgi:hypothetical protein
MKLQSFVTGKKETSFPSYIHQMFHMGKQCAVEAFAIGMELPGRDTVFSSQSTFMELNTYLAVVLLNTPRLIIIQH